MSRSRRRQRYRLRRRQRIVDKFIARFERLLARTIEAKVKKIIIDFLPITDEQKERRVLNLSFAVPPISHITIKGKIDI